MEVCTLASGSSGNSLLICCGSTYVLLDAGISARRITSALKALGADPTRLSAVLVTHEHTDHVSGISLLLVAFPVELYASIGTPGTRRYLDELPFCQFVPGVSFEVAGISVRTFPTSHDVVNPVGFRFDCAGDSIGYATDTGYLTEKDQMASAQNEGNADAE